jgi:predicted ATPase/class 3 adenylate cyclase/Tfp pilus assembly protein PilF
MVSKSKRALAAVMFSDLEGFSAMMHNDEFQARAILGKFLAVNNDMHKKYDGQIINFFGDGTLSIFFSSVKAISCAIEIQKKLWKPENVPLRIGIDVGDILIDNGNILGDAVNLASRIESFSVPGAILISDSVYHQIKNQREFQFKSLGKFNFKNISRPCEVYAIANEGIQIPNANSITGKGSKQSDNKNRLPKVFTSFLGRSTEIEEIKELLLHHQLLTLTGPGGTGKTRLTIELAEAVEENYRDGIFWVPMTSVWDANDVGSEILKQLQLQEDPVKSIEEVIVDFFFDKNALLIIDNFEQVLDAAKIIERFLQRCPDLTIMITSRILLQISGEREYQVPPLLLPDLGISNTMEHLEKIPSVALFRERAQASRKNFELTEENISSVAEICVRLDGLPLAIELAAARSKIFNPNELLLRLQKTMDILKGGGQFPTRHQTMRQTIEWSYDLLDSLEQTLFRRLSVFVGGCNMEAIETVCIVNSMNNLDTVDRVMALVDKSLLSVDESHDDFRFHLLQTIREYAGRALNQTEEALTIKKAHIHYYLELSEKAAPHFYSSAEDWAVIINRELSNLRAAIDYSIELDEMKLGYRLGQALMPFWSFRGMTANEGVQQLEKLTSAKVSENLAVERLKILQTLARYYGYTPYRSKAKPILEECLSFWRQQGDLNQIGLVLNDFGWYYIEDGSDYDKAETFSMEAKSIFESLSNKSRLVASLNNLGFSNLIRGKPLEALPYFKRTRMLTETLGDDRRNAQAILNTGYCSYKMGKYDIAEAQIQEALIPFRKHSSKIFEETALLILSYIYFEYGFYEKCKELSIEIEKIGKQTNTVFAINSSMEVRAMAEYGLGNLPEAVFFIEKAIYRLELFSFSFYSRALTSQSKIAWAMGDLQLVRSCSSKLVSLGFGKKDYSSFIPGLEISARIAMMDKDYVSAAQLFFNAQALRSWLGTPIVPSEEETYKDFQNELKNILGRGKLAVAQTVKMNEMQLSELASLVLSSSRSH